MVPKIWTQNFLVVQIKFGSISKIIWGQKQFWDNKFIWSEEIFEWEKIGSNFFGSTKIWNSKKCWPKNILVQIGLVWKNFGVKSFSCQAQVELGFWRLFWHNISSSKNLIFVNICWVQMTADIKWCHMQYNISSTYPIRHTVVTKSKHPINLIWMNTSWKELIWIFDKSST